MNLPLITEIHTGDLTAECLRAVQLKHEGKYRGEYTEALYRGQVGHQALEQLHRDITPGRWESVDVEQLIEAAGQRVLILAQTEDRPLSDAMKRPEKQRAVLCELWPLISEYIARFTEYFGGCTLIGVEVPMRWTMDLPRGGTQDFATHIDLLYRHKDDGQLCIRDWKFQDEPPTMAYLGRNLQFVLMYMGVAYGSCMLTDPILGDHWGQFHEFPDLGWIDMQRLKPYGRKTTTVDRETGEEHTWAKGDIRPIDRIMRRWTFNPDQEDAMLDELALRVRMIHAGMFPTRPSKLGCHVCESQLFCDAFHLPKRDQKIV